VLKSRAYPDMVFRGTVTTIATAAEGLPQRTAEEAAGKPGATSSASVRSFIVTTQIENGSGLLKPGMTGLAKVRGGDRRVVDLVKRRLTHTFKVEFWSWCNGRLPGRTHPRSRVGSHGFGLATHQRGGADQGPRNRIRTCI